MSFTVQINVATDSATPAVERLLDDSQPRHIADLLDYWNLADDIQYPWRTDTNCTSGPLLSYFEANETPAVVCFNTSVPEGFTSGSTTVTTDGFTATFTFSPATSGPDEGVGPVSASLSGSIIDNNPENGSVLGAPLPHGCDAYFDFRAQNYDGSYDFTGYGELSPWASATQWTNLVDEASLLPGAFAAYNSLQIGVGDGGGYSGGQLIKSKYAEVILLSAPSHDFARPCGPKDAETIDQNSIDCSGDGGTYRWMGIENPCPVPPATGGEWNDNMPKGDFCLLTWTFNFRDAATRGVTGAWNGINCSQECAGFVPCCPAVVIISPASNGDFSSPGPNGQAFAHTTLDCDQCYGSLWQQCVQQWMTDPLWQAPKIPCSLTDPDSPDYDPAATWHEDDGSGIGDGSMTGHDYYYPQQPYEEALCAVPDGAPGLPTGCFIGVLDVASINAAGSYEAAAADGNVVMYPSAGDCFMPVWVWAINRLTAARWTCEYANPVAICDDDVEIDAP